MDGASLDLRSAAQDYLLFNPSPLAASPDQCCATWQTSDGKRPKTLVAEPATGSDVIVEDLEAPRDPPSARPADRRRRRQVQRLCDDDYDVTSTKRRQHRQRRW